jgi:hypothetical protein
VNFMCGSSGAQQKLSAQQAAFFGELQQSYGTEFAGQQQILNTLTNALTPILQAGPGQQGFSPQEAAAINTQIGQGVGANYAKASQALNTQLAARGGGNEALPTGASGQLNEALASQAAQTMSGEQLQATEQNYQQGLTNFWNAQGALGGTANIFNPASFAGQTTGAGNAAFGSATQMYNQGNAWIGALGGALGGAVNAFGGTVGKGLGQALFPSQQPQGPGG